MADPARCHDARCPLCGFLMWTDGLRAWCPRILPRHRRCGHGLRGGLDREPLRLPIPTIIQRLARLGRAS